MRDKELQSPIERISERLTLWVGSPASIVFHSLFFVGIFALRFLGISFDHILLMLTTVVSLEAIYLAIFIQMSVNQNTSSLREVEADVDEIQGDVDEIQKDPASLRRAFHMVHRRAEFLHFFGQVLADRPDVRIGRAAGDDEEIRHVRDTPQVEQDDVVRLVVEADPGGPLGECQGILF